MAFSDIEINLQQLNLTVRGRRYLNGDKHKVLCLHGWLDNANSFQPLMPLLNDCETVAIDLPGHGHSDHTTDPYTLANSAHYVLEVAEQLKWKDYHLLGHSMGGCIAPFAAVASPDCIQSLMFIDAAGPMTETAQQLPQRLGRFHRELKKFQSYQSRVFETKEHAVESRLKANKMNTESAALIIERQLRKTDQGYHWRFDGKLRAASATYFTEEQVKAVLSAVTCPVQCILAEDGYLQEQKFKQRLRCVENLDLITLPGNHHLHMDTPEAVAEEINRFLLSFR